MNTYKIIWTGPKSDIESAVTILTEVIYPPAEGVSFVEDIQAPNNDWRLEAYFVDKPDLAAIESQVNQMQSLAPGIVEELKDRDWVADSLEGLGVIEAGRFILYGTHDADKIDVKETSIPIRIDANQAFGTGHHPTTAGCLSLLDRLGGFAPKSILDLGCGSAILAIAAAKMWHRNVLASDIDSKSVEIAHENVALNGVGGEIQCVTAEGFAHSEIKATTPFDFIFANILAGPLKELAPDMARHVRKNGRVMLAGLMSEQEEGVIEAYTKNGFRVINKLEQETWPVLLFVKQSD